MHSKHILGSYKGDPVGLDRQKICMLTVAVSQVLGLTGPGGAYMTTRSLKHIYEQRTAAEYQLILDKLHSLLRRPQEVYLNKPEKRGTHCLVGALRGQEYICVIEIVSEREIEIATVFERRERYLDHGRGCVLLWSWGDGTNSHRIVLDADACQSSNNPQ